MDPKPHKSYEEQLALLEERGMKFQDRSAALKLVKHAGYYTLSGYWYPFRVKQGDGTRGDEFRPGTKFEDIRAFWDFDNRLRAVTLAALQPIETYLRALLAHELGAVDPLVHEKPELLSIDKGIDYNRWLSILKREIRKSREEYIRHHRETRNGIIPIWVATGVLDWGGLSHLYSISPYKVREKISTEFLLSTAQLKSWLRSLNIVRNVCAHHSRFFNRHYSVTPKLPASNPTFEELRSDTDATFLMLTLVQHLGQATLGFNRRLVPAVLQTFPKGRGLDLGAMGAPTNWEKLPLWCSTEPR